MLSGPVSNRLLKRPVRPVSIPKVPSNSKYIIRRQRIAGPSYGIPQSSDAPVTKNLDTKAASTEQDEPSPFFEPLLRSFVLGLSAGAIVESGHIIFKLAGVALSFSSQELLDWLPTAADQLAPWFVWDHVAAMTSWMALYIVEAVAVISVLNQYPNDKEQARTSLRSLVTFPKKIMPLKLQFVKSLYSAMDRRAFASATSSAAVLSRPLRDVAAVNQFVGSGTAFPTKPATDKVDDVVVPKVPVGPPLVQKSPAQVDKPMNREGLKPGAFNPTATPFAKRQKELNDRRAYLKNFWYAVAISDKLKDKPIGVDILGRRVVLWRGQDAKVHCLDDACPHRGAPLSMGRSLQKNGEEVLECPYHGWTFDCQGRLREVPALDDADNWPKRELIESYPVEEKGGFIWLFFGSKQLPKEERPPIPYTPELDDPKWKPVYGELEFECGHWGVFENAIDMAHIHYLHGDTFGNEEQPKIHDMKVARDAYGVEATFRIHNKPVSPLWEFTKTPSVPVVAKAYLPSTSSITIELGAGISFITFVNTVPISATRCVNRFCLVRNFAGWDGFDTWARKAMFRILGEDKVMVEKLRPEMLNFEVSLSPDLPQIEFRKLRQEYINMGYGVAPELEEQRVLGDM